jgi:hypothetical protein
LKLPDGENHPERGERVRPFHKSKGIDVVR